MAMSALLLRVTFLPRQVRWKEALADLLVPQLSSLNLDNFSQESDLLNSFSDTFTYLALA